MKCRIWQGNEYARTEHMRAGEELINTPTLTDNILNTTTHISPTLPYITTPTPPKFPHQLHRGPGPGTGSLDKNFDRTKERSDASAELW